MAAEATPFAETPRGQLRDGEHVVRPVSFYTADGTEYVAKTVGEINRLRLSRDYFDSPAAAEAGPESADDHRFHPGDHTVAEVLEHLEGHPEDAERVLAEERSGKARTTILGEK